MTPFHIYHRHERAMLPYLRMFKYMTSLIFTVLLLAGCGSKSTTKRAHKPHLSTSKLHQADKSEVVSGWTEAYLNNKEEVAQKRAIKKRMKAELPSTNLKTLSYEQLAKARAYYDELGQHDRAALCYERMLAINKDPMQLNNMRLELADRCFESGDFEKASKLYLGFLEFYPGSDKREYVEYKAILSHFYITLSNDRDQTETKNTLALTQSFLDHGSLYKEYADEVKHIQKQCYEKLTQSEMNICQFHVRHGNSKGAEQRLAYINKHLRRHAPTLEPELLALETSVKGDTAIQIPDMPDFTPHEGVVFADNTDHNPSKRMANRF